MNPMDCSLKTEINIVKFLRYLKAIRTYSSREKTLFKQHEELKINMGKNVIVENKPLHRKYIQRAKI